VTPPQAIAAVTLRPTEALIRWEKRTDWPLSAVAMIFLIAYAIPIVNPATGQDPRDILENVMVVAWATFGLDYVVRLCLSKGQRWTFVKKHPLDLAVVVLPILRPLRLVRLFSLLSILNRAGTRHLRGRVITYAVGGSIMLVTMGALAITEAESNAPGTHIHDIWDGLWWALTTITSVGYGDTFPVTSTGRVIAMALMAGGVALLGVVSATLASWLVQKVSEAEVDSQAAVVQRLEQVVQDMHQIKDLLGPTNSAVHLTRPAEPAEDSVNESSLRHVEGFLQQGFQAAQRRGDRADELAWSDALCRFADIRTSLEDSQSHGADQTRRQMRSQTGLLQMDT
jgi:voltage-gated potassium channel